jgi:hypothetical protein
MIIFRPYGDIFFNLCKNFRPSGQETPPLATLDQGVNRNGFYFARSKRSCGALAMYAKRPALFSEERE